MFFKKLYTCIDIGVHSIKAVQLKADKNSVDIIDAGIIKLPQETIVDGLIMDDSLVATEMQNLFNSLNKKAKNIITTVPNNDLIIRSIEIPKLDKKDINESLKWETDEQLPYPVENASLGYHLVSEEEEVFKYIVAAVRENVVDNYQQPFKRLNLNPRVINVQPMALVSLLNYQNEIGDNTVAIIDIGASDTQITIANRDNIMLSRTIDTGGNSFTNEIMDIDSLDFQQAEEKKFETSLLNEFDNTSEQSEESEEEFVEPLPIGMEIESENYNMDNLASNLASEITRSIDYFNMKNREKEINKVFLTGGGSRLNGLFELISSEL